MDTEKTEMSQVVSQSQKENLPIAGRRWEGFALLTPNVTTDGGTGLVSYRGISGLYNQSSVDGTNNSQAFFSETKGRTTVALRLQHGFDSGIPGQLQQLQRGVGAGRRRRRQRGNQVGHQPDPRRPVLLPALSDA